MRKRQKQNQKITNDDHPVIHIKGIFIVRGIFKAIKPEIFAMILTTGGLDTFKPFGLCYGDSDRWYNLFNAIMYKDMNPPALTLDPNKYEPQYRIKYMIRYPTTPNIRFASTSWILIYQTHQNKLAEHLTEPTEPMVFTQDMKVFITKNSEGVYVFKTIAEFEDPQYQSQYLEEMLFPGDIPKTSSPSTNTGATSKSGLNYDTMKAVLELVMKDKMGLPTTMPGTKPVTNPADAYPLWVKKKEE